MTPAARLSAAIEVLDQLARTRMHADVALKRWGQDHRFAGSGDRRAIAERVYGCLRERGRLAAFMVADDGRALVLASLALSDGLGLREIDSLFSGATHAPKALDDAERARLERRADAPSDDDWSAGLPSFLAESFVATWGAAAPEEVQALTRTRAPTDLRVNGAKASVETVMAELTRAGVAAERTPWSAWGLRLSGGAHVDVLALDAFKDGLFEVQDEGSQIVSWLAGARPGTTVVDYCAGGGGKTLALACGLAGGRMVACDPDPRRLDNVRPRLVRAGVEADLRRLGPAGEGVEDLTAAADLAFVDAPCSGSGAWRRRPEEIWRLTEAEVERLHALQVAILGRAADLVRLGGRLVYVTCSVLTRENEAVAAVFGAARPDFRPVSVAAALDTLDLTDAARERLAPPDHGHTLRLSPASTGTDGFFAALYERTA